MDEDASRVQATETSFRLLEALQGNQGAGVSELARAVDRSKSTVHKHLQTLVGMGYLTREGNGYYFSRKFRDLGDPDGSPLLAEEARTVVEDLADSTGQVANFMAREGDHGVYRVRICPRERDGTDISVGDRAPLHATAAGKAILAYLSADERDAVLAETGLPAYTDKTITDRDRLERELQSIRDRGVSFDRREFIADQQCVASPVRDGSGDPVGSVSVSGHVDRLSGKRLEEDVTGLVTSAAKSVERDLLSD
ncbi:MAG: IclR family transcriptional regulator [Haloarculaceae archaeon]